MAIYDGVIKDEKKAEREINKRKIDETTNTINRVELIDTGKSLYRIHATTKDGRSFITVAHLSDDLAHDWDTLGKIINSPDEELDIWCK